MKLVVVIKNYVSKTGEVKESNYLAIELDNGKQIRIKPVYESETIELVLKAEKKVVNSEC